MNSGHAAGVYYCLQGSFICVFQRLSTLKWHLPLLKCTQSLERHSLVDYKHFVLQTLLGASVGALLKAAIGHQKPLLFKKRAISDKQQSFLLWQNSA